MDPVVLRLRVGVLILRKIQNSVCSLETVRIIDWISNPNLIKNPSIIYESLLVDQLVLIFESTLFLV